MVPTEAAETSALTDPGYKRLTTSQMHLILHLAADNRTQVEIAGIVGVSQSTVSRFLSQVADPYKIVQQLMRGQTLEAMSDWRRARRNASRRGDHRPAREWIEMAYPELRPQPTDHSTGVTVYVAVPGANNPRPVIDVVKGSTVDAQQSESALCVSARPVHEGGE
jgi:hypothetical protein